MSEACKVTAAVYTAIFHVALGLLVGGLLVALHNCGG